VRPGWNGSHAGVTRAFRDAKRASGDRRRADLFAGTQQSQSGKKKESGANRQRSLNQTINARMWGDTTIKTYASRRLYYERVLRIFKQVTLSVQVHNRPVPGRVKRPKRCESEIELH